MAELLNTDLNYYINGAKRMVVEGNESVSKIMAYMKEHEESLKAMTKEDRKAFILKFEPAKLFSHVHPIVFHYLVVEGVYNANAFRRYIISVFGKKRSLEDEEYMRKGRRNLYYFKNKQYALYYKYMISDANPHIKVNDIHILYEKVVDELNSNIDAMLDKYESAEEASKLAEVEYTDEKRKDLLDLLKKKINA